MGFAVGDRAMLDSSRHDEQVTWAQVRHTVPMSEPMTFAKPVGVGRKLA